MFDELQSLLAGLDADYADARYEVRKQDTVTFNGRHLGHVDVNTSDGFVVRVFKGGGCSTALFNGKDDARAVCEKALQNALLMSRTVGEPVRLASAPVIHDTVLPRLEEDPRKVPLEEKIELTRRYIGIPLASPQVASANLTYKETLRERYFVNSEGSRIREDLLTTTYKGLITSREGNLLQSVRVNAGGSHGFSQLRDREELFEQRTRLARDLLRAEPFAGGSHPVLLNGSLSGVLVHEAFGHLSEADLIENIPTLRKKMHLGAVLGSERVNIRDDATPYGQLGYYRYDDEGVAVRPVQLMKNGVLTGRLHSRRTASAMGEPLTGHCVAEDFRFSPMIRMGTIYLEPGPSSVQALLDQMGDGLYLCDPKGGETSGEGFTFCSGYGWVIKDGKKTRMIRDVNLSGNLFETLGRVVGVGNDLELIEGGGACGKADQANIRSCLGAPHTLLSEVLVGGA